MGKFSRQKVVDLITSWLGYSEANGKYKQIIDIYNSYDKQLPRCTKMQYSWPWCACTWSAIAIKLGYTEIMPIEISCERLIEEAKKMDCWVEKDAYVPMPGDAILYDWDDGNNYASIDNVNSPDHVGIVVYVNEKSGYMEVIEGNYSDSVKKRSVSINGRFIRGFITPKYDDNSYVKTPVCVNQKDNNVTIETVAREVIIGKWGTGNKRKTSLIAAGFDYELVQAKVNEILNEKCAQPQTKTQEQNQQCLKKVVATECAQKYSKSLSGTYKATADLYCRNGAGNNKKALVVIPKGTKVQCYGYYNTFSTVRWLYIQVIIDGVQYTGFSSNLYLAKN